MNRGAVDPPQLNSDALGRPHVLCELMLIALLTSLLISSTFALGQCPDLSGNYVVQGEDGRTYFRITQTGCDFITFVEVTRSYDGITRSSWSLKLDGSVALDSTLPSRRIARSATFKGDSLEVKVRPLEAPNSMVVARHLFYPTPRGDVCHAFVDGSKRQASLYAVVGADDEEAAAARSGPMARQPNGELYLTAQVNSNRVRPT